MIRCSVGSDPAGMALRTQVGWATVDDKRRKIGSEGLEPFGLAGFRRIWGHVGACCPVGLFLVSTAKRQDEPNVRNTEALVGRRDEQVVCGGARRSWYDATR